MYKRVSGSWTSLGTPQSVTITADVQYTVALTVEGTSISATLNGANEITDTDSAISAKGEAGLCTGTGIDAGGSVWDTFSVDSLSNSIPIFQNYYRQRRA
jgi:PKD repeat protein